MYYLSSGGVQSADLVQLRPSLGSAYTGDVARQKVRKVDDIDPEDERQKRGIRFEPECVDLILDGINEMKSSYEIAKEVAAQFNVSVHAGRARVDRIWDLLSKEAKLDRTVDRQKVSRALLDMYRTARQDMDIARTLQLMEDFNMQPREVARILTKWDPYQSSKIALKALDQYSKLQGLYEPITEEPDEQELLNPLSLTPQERRKRIQELLAKGAIGNPAGVAGGYSTGHHGSFSDDESGSESGEEASGVPLLPPGA